MNIDNFVDDIQKLIARGRLKDAIKKIVEQSKDTDIANDVTLLSGRFERNEAYNRKGIISNSEYNRTINQITAAALELLNDLKSDPKFNEQESPDPGDPNPIPATPQPIVPEPIVPEPGQNKPSPRKIFISYSTQDKAIARKLKALLESRAYDVIIDEEDFRAGVSLFEAIKDSIDQSSGTVFIVSKAAILSGWVGMETVLRLQQGQFIRIAN